VPGVVDGDGPGEPLAGGWLDGATTDGEGVATSAGVGAGTVVAVGVAVTDGEGDVAIGMGESSATAGELAVGLAEGVAMHAATTVASATGTQRRTRFPSGIMRTIRDTLRDGLPPPEDLLPTMPAVDRSAPALLRAVGLLPDGPGQWGRPLRSQGGGVFVVELPSPLATAPLDHGHVGRWLERVEALRLDGARPTGRELLTRLAQFWLPAESVLFVGSTTGSIAGRAAAMAKTELGERKPAPSGHWLHALTDPGILRIWWAATEAPEEYEDALLSEFADGVSEAERAALPDTAVVLPWANLRTVTGERKATGIANPLVPDTSPAPPPPVSTIVELPTAEADGARDEAKRRARPAPGRGVGRVASAAAYAAQGSPRKAAPEPVYLSPEGRDRMEAELRQLTEVERPAVIKRIATAREHGDLKENAEYHAAREEQGFLENRIRTMEQTLKVATIVEPEARGAVVGVGTRLRVAHEGDELDLMIVGSAEADPASGRISNVSPVGRALIGRRVGDVVTVVTPGGDRRYELLAIE